MSGRLWAVASTAARRTAFARAEVAMRGVFYLILLVIFARLWSTMAASGRLAGIGAASFVWYLALTEWVTLATPVAYLSIEEEVRRGDVAYRLARPVSYLQTKVWEGLGEAAVRLAFLAVVALVFGRLLAGGWPDDPRGLLLAIPLGLLSCAVLLLMQVAVGLSAFWLHEASPVFWILQKTQFVFGGLMFPLEIYPGWLRSVCAYTPFGPLIYGCGRMALGFDPALAAVVALKILAWGVVIALFVAWLYGRALRNLQVHGG